MANGYIARLTGLINKVNDSAVELDNMLDRGVISDSCYDEMHRMYVTKIEAYMDCLNEYQLRGDK